MIDAGLEGPNGRRAQPQIPFEICRNRVFTLRASDALRPNWAVGPYMNLLDRSDQTRLHHLNGAAQTFFGAALVAHLGHDAMLLCQGAKVSRFIDSLR